MKAALLVIDAQNIYTDSTSELFCEDEETTVNNINRLIAAARKNDQPVIFIKHQHKADESDCGYLFDHEGTGSNDGISFIEGTPEVELDSRIKVEPGDKIITKTRYSSFAGTILKEVLEEKAIQRVIICGFMTNFCCESTARNALDIDFVVDFVSDATGTPGTSDYNQEEIREIVGNILREGFARVFKTTEDYLENK